MQRRFFSLEELEEMGYKIIDPENIPVIEKHLAQEIELYITDDLRIESEAGIYLTEVSFNSPY